MPEEVENEVAHAEKKKGRKKRKPKPGRVDLPAHLPRVEEVTACSPEQCRCWQCGQSTLLIGHEESEILEVKHAEYFVRLIRREKRACSCCPDEGAACAAAPERIIEKGKLLDSLVIDTTFALTHTLVPLT